MYVTDKLYAMNNIPQKAKVYYEGNMAMQRKTADKLKK
jgi:hypothetical protein